MHTENTNTNRASGARSTNPCDLAYWKDRSLHYSRHALDRIRERDLPILSTLPEDARLSDVTRLSSGEETSVSFKVGFGEGQEAHTLVIRPDGVVITAYAHDKDKNKRMQTQDKQRRLRRHLAFAPEWMFVATARF